MKKYMNKDENNEECGYNLALILYMVFVGTVLGLMVGSDIISILH